MNRTWKIIFKGETLPEFSPQTVAVEITQLLKLTSKQTKKLFSGKTVILKKNLSQFDAKKLQVFFSKKGLHIYLQAENIEPIILAPEPAFSLELVQTLSLEPIE